jgi:hypothetical protein
MKMMMIVLMAKAIEEYPETLLTTGTQRSEKLSDLFASVGIPTENFEPERRGGKIPPYYILYKRTKSTP